MQSDTELLRSYAQDRSESAFTELVQRHIDLVYSAALREAHGDASSAEDITQAVFAELARKASSLIRHPALAGWLYTCVRHMSANARRAEDRRQRREQEAQTMNELLSSDSSDPVWNQVQPVLDNAMHELGEVDRAAVVLRFFEDRSLKEVGLALGLNENAARMRVDRALDKLQSLLAKRGITSTASGLAAAIVAGAVVSAPTGLAASVAAGAAAVTASAAPTAFTVLKLMTMAKLKIAAASALIVAAVAVPVWQQTRFNRLARENNQLQSQAGEIPQLRQEVQQLRRIEVDRAELERLRGAEARLQSEVAKLRNRVGSGQRAETEAAQLRDEVNREKNNPKNAILTNAMASGLAVAKGWHEQHLLGQIARMKEKLNLTADQEQAVHDVLMRKIESGVQTTQKALTGKLTAEEMVEMRKPADNPEEEIKALLSPEQQAAYPDYKREETAANARDDASSDLALMRNALGLSQEQQDQLYPVLYNLSLNQATGPADSSANPPATDANYIASFERQIERQKEQLEQKLKSLEPILSPKQLETYRQSQEARINRMKDMIPLMKAMIPRENGGSPK